MIGLLSMGWDGDLCIQETLGVGKIQETQINSGTQIWMLEKILLITIVK